MTTRLFAVIAGWFLLLMVAIGLAMLPEIHGAGLDTIRSCQGLAIVVLVIGTPLVAVVVVSTWIWEIARRALSRRSVRQG